MGLITGWELGNGEGLLGGTHLVCGGTGLLAGGGLGVNSFGFGAGEGLGMAFLGLNFFGLGLAVA